MISVLFSRVIMLTAGMLYPAYRSYKAVRTKDGKEYVKWMMYWIVFALFHFCEIVADILIAFWFPFYYELKIIFVLWLLSPWTKGASILYRKWIHPLFMKHEEDIDAMLEQAKAESYKQVVNLGSRGLMCAREIVTTAALRGQAQLAQQMQRSYSTGDVNLEQLSIKKPKMKVIDVVEEEEEQVRTWAGVYDEQGRMVEQSVSEFGEEEVVVIEDPTSSDSQKSAQRQRKNRSRSRNTDSGSASENHTLPRRSSRLTAQP